MNYNGSNDYMDIYNLNVGQTPSLSFTYEDEMWGSQIIGMSTTMTYNNLNTSVEGYYYRIYRATDNSNYDLEFKIVFKVGNPTGGPTVPQEHIHFNYDSTWQDQLTGYGTIDYINGVAQTEVSVQDYIYDNQGNPITITNFYYNGTTYHHADLEYDGRQLMKVIVYSDSGENNEIVTLSYTYNDKGYRTSKTIDDGTPKTIDYTLNGDKVIYETDGTYAITYTYDYDSKIISFNYDQNINDSTDGIEYFYIRNQQGDITKILDKDGNLEVEYKYDAWGNLIDVNDYSGQEEVSYINEYTYRGYRYDSEVKLYYLNSRFYNPNTGRFLNADVVLGTKGNIIGHNLYSYAGNDPINRVDFSGYKWNWNKIAKVAVIATLAVVTVAAIAVTAGGAAAIAGPMLFAYTGATWGAAAAYTTGAVLAGATLAFAANDINTEISGSNFVAEKMLGGDEALYDTLNNSVKIASGIFITVGALGNTLANSGKEANHNGYTRHGWDSRTGANPDHPHGVNDMAFNDALSNPIEIIPQQNGTYQYIGQYSTVVLNETGDVVTCWATSSDGYLIP